MQSHEIDVCCLFYVIQQGIEQLQALIPGCHPGEEDSNGVFTKQSKAQVLQKCKF